MIVSIHQPSYWPWLGHLNKIINSEHHIILDDVDIKRKSFQYRNFFNNNGKPSYLTLPVNKTSREKINQIYFKNRIWPEEHLKNITIYYKNAKHFEEIYTLIKPVYLLGRDMKPSEFLISTIKLSMLLFNIQVPLTISSTLNIDGLKGNKILNLIKKINGSIYLSGYGAKSYLDEDKNMFIENNIKVMYNDFKHPQYKQFSNSPFVTGLSGLDLLFFEGLENARKTIKKQYFN